MQIAPLFVCESAVFHANNPGSDKNLRQQLRGEHKVETFLMDAQRIPSACLVAPGHKDNRYQNLEKPHSYLQYFSTEERTAKSKAEIG